MGESNILLRVLHLVARGDLHGGGSELLWEPKRGGKESNGAEHTLRCTHCSQRGRASPFASSVHSPHHLSSIPAHPWPSCPFPSPFSPQPPWRSSPCIVRTTELSSPGLHSGAGSVGVAHAPAIQRTARMGPHSLGHPRPTNLLTLIIGRLRNSATIRLYTTIQIQSAEIHIRMLRLCARLIKTPPCA